MNFRVAFCAAMLAGASLSAANAAVILEVDLTVPDQVTITATSAASEGTISGSDGIGVYLENFYSVAGGGLFVADPGDLTSSLNVSNGNVSLFRGGGGADPGLNIWDWTDDLTSEFTTGVQAFSGSVTVSLSPAQYADMLTFNSTGDVYAFADTADDIGGPENPVVIGQYIAFIPEPATMALLGLGGIAMLRRRRS